MNPIVICERSDLLESVATLTAQNTTLRIEAVQAQAAWRKLMDERDALEAEVSGGRIRPASGVGVMGNDWRVRVAVMAANAYYRKPDNGVGGVLHIVLDDGNLEAQHVTFCLNEARKCDDRDGEALALMLSDMTQTQRAKVYASYNRYAL